MPFAEKRIGICECCDEECKIACRGLCQRCYKAVRREEQAHALVLTAIQSQTFSAPLAGPPDPDMERLIAEYATGSCRTRSRTSWLCAAHERSILECLNRSVECATRLAQRDYDRLAAMVARMHRRAVRAAWDQRSTAPIRRGMHVATRAAAGVEIT